jgi:hypothetical protein
MFSSDAVNMKVLGTPMAGCLVIIAILIHVS